MIDQVKKRIAEIEAQPEVDDNVDDDEEEAGSGQDESALEDAEARLEVSCKTVCNTQTLTIWNI